MNNGKLISFQTIMDNVMRDHPFVEGNIDDEKALEWLGSFMQLANSPIVMEDKQHIVELESGRAKLPDDMYRLMSVARAEEGCTLEQVCNGDAGLCAMRWATDTFHNRYHCDNRDYTSASADTYTVNNNYVFTSISNKNTSSIANASTSENTPGILVMAYKAIPTDDDGYPMIPGDEQWVKAAEFQLAYKVAYILWANNKLADKVYYQVERDKKWYFASAVNYSKMLSLDQMEGLKNQSIATVPRVNEHSTFFANLQLPEKRKWRSR